jgi:hypothetical protein
MYRYNSPPNWPPSPSGWTPPEGWLPNPAWGPAPEGWNFWTWEEPPAVPIPPAAPGVLPPPAPMPIAYGGPPPQPSPAVRHTGRNIALVIVALAVGLIVVGVVVAGLSSKSATTKGTAAGVATPTRSPVVSTPAPSQTASALSQAASASSQTASTPAAPSSAAAPSGTSSAVLLGATHGFVYTDGLVVSVLSATKFVPSSDAAGTAPGDTGVLLQVRITNGTKATFDLSLSQVDLNAGANGDQGQSIDQSGPPDLGLGFSGSIAPGQSATAPFGFDVPTADLPNIGVSVTPDFSHDDATFVGQVAP